MPNIRTCHNKENPFVQLNKKTLWDSSISLEAIGLWARLLSRPDDWEISVAELCKSCKASKTKIQNLLKELVKNGYAFRYQTLVEKGKRKNLFGAYETLVFEYKVTEEEIKEMFPELNFPEPEKPEPGNRTTTNKENTKKENTTKKENKQKKAPKPKKPEPSALALKMLAVFISSLAKNLPEIKDVPKAKEAIHFDTLLKRGYTEQDIEDVIAFSHRDDFWIQYVLDPNYLRTKFTKLLSASKHKGKSQRKSGATHFNNDFSAEEEQIKKEREELKKQRGNL